MHRNAVNDPQRHESDLDDRPWCPDLLCSSYHVSVIKQDLYQTENIEEFRQKRMLKPAVRGKVYEGIFIQPVPVPPVSGSMVRRCRIMLIMQRCRLNDEALHFAMF